MQFDLTLKAFATLSPGFALWRPRRTPIPEAAPPRAIPIFHCTFSWRGRRQPRLQSTAVSLGAVVQSTMSLERRSAVAICRGDPDLRSCRTRSRSFPAGAAWPERFEPGCRTVGAACFSRPDIRVTFRLLPAPASPRALGFASCGPVARLLCTERSCSMISGEPPLDVHLVSPEIAFAHGRSIACPPGEAPEDLPADAAAENNS